ncbi:MAG: hypothetical protein ACOC1I_08085 [Spirochaetota bacterium]
MLPAHLRRPPYPRGERREQYACLLDIYSTLRGLYAKLIGYRDRWDDVEREFGRRYWEAFERSREPGV